MNDIIIQVKDLSKIYETETIETVALSNISLTIKRGEFVAIMGPSGSGKSTFMHILGALDLPTSGEYFLDGENVAKMGEDELADVRNRKIGFIFQAYNLLPRTSALDNVILPMAYAGIPENKQLEKATKLLEIVGLSNRMHHGPNQLSGGQQQRVAIARALTMNPSILLADEPTGNIASNQADEIMGIFQDLNNHNHTVVMITHEPDIAAFSKRIIMIRDGKLIDDKLNKNRHILKK